MGPIGPPERPAGWTRRSIAAIWLAIVLLAVPLPASAGAAEDASRDPSASLSAPEILERAIELAESQHEAGIEFRYESLVKERVESLNKQGETVRVETATYRRYPVEGTWFVEQIERDGKPLSEREARAEQKRRAKFEREARSHAARGETYDPDERRSMRFGREMMSRYRPTLDGTEEIQGHRCWIVRFVPRSGPLPQSNRMDKALNRSTGRLWITQEGFHVARVTFQMQQPVEYLWGVLATLRKVDGRLDFEPVEPGFWSPRKFQIELDLSLLMSMKAIRRRISNEWIVQRGEPSRAEPAPVASSGSGG